MNLILQELGFSPADRVVVIHADDIGMYQSALPALEELLAFGLVTSASVMAPCPWLPDVAAWRRKNSHVDLGVHLTLTSEWEHYRWGPVSPCLPTSGLIDGHGYFHRTTAALCENAKRDEVRAELIAQLDRADRIGLAPTHIDTHMLAALQEPFREDYLQVGFGRGIPAFLPRRLSQRPDSQNCLPNGTDAWERRGMPVFDAFDVATRRTADHDAFVREMFRQLPVGLSCVLLHPAKNTEELRFITDGWEARVADFEAFRQPSLRDFIQQLGIQLISYGVLGDAMRRRTQASSW